MLSSSESHRVMGLEESIQMTLELCPLGHPERGIVMSNIAATLGMQYERMGSQTEYERRYILKTMVKLLDRKSVV